MVFGIDLGTTNSLIGSGDKLYSGLVSSSVDVSKARQVNREYVSQDVCSSYKINMSIGSEGALSVYCSTVIIRELAEIAASRSGEEVKEVVISVPAYFSTSQREAVYQAAANAGLTVRALLNEPTAAALYVCKDSQELIVVYDLGGGTFDVSIVDSRLGSYRVVATDGIVLGGDNLDEALASKIMSEGRIPFRERGELARLKFRGAVRMAKEELQRTRESVQIDLSVFGDHGPYLLTVEKYKELIRRVFGRTILLTQNLISRSVPEGERIRLVFVGGSSYCPYLRKMVQEEIVCGVVDCDTAPDYIVAKGVASYAKMIEDGTAREIVEDVTKRLSIEDDKGGTLTVIEPNTIIPCRATIMVSNAQDSDRLQVKLFQGNSYHAAANDYIGTLIYKYGEWTPAKTGVVEVTVEVSMNGIIRLQAEDSLYGESSRQEIALTAR